MVHERELHFALQNQTTMPIPFGDIFPNRKRFASCGYLKNFGREFHTRYWIGLQNIAQSETAAMAMYSMDRVPETIFSFHFTYHRYDISS